MPCPSAIVALTALPSCTLKVRFASTAVLPMTKTLIVFCWFRWARTSADSTCSRSPRLPSRIRWRWRNYGHGRAGRCGKADREHERCCSTIAFGSCTSPMDSVGSTGGGTGSTLPEMVAGGETSDPPPQAWNRKCCCRCPPAIRAGFPHRSPSCSTRRRSPRRN